MSSPAGSEGTNSFEDAENGNSGEGKNGATTGEGKPSATGEATGASGAGITLSDDDISFLMQGGRPAGGDHQAQTPKLPAPVQLPGKWVTS